MEFVVDNMQNGYISLIEHVLNHGHEVSPRGQDTIEVNGATIVLTRPQYATPIDIGRNLNITLASAETTHLIAGISDAAQLIKITPMFSQFANGSRLRGAYGPRLFNQLPNVLHLLSTDSDTRQASVNIWRPNELEDVENNDVPCTLNLHWFIRDGKLDAYTLMRSNDAFLGVPYDITMFTRLQMTLAWTLGVDVGTYTHTALSLHVYKRDLPAIEKLHTITTCTPSPITAYNPPDTRPGERDGESAVHRLARARHWAKLAMLSLPTKMILPQVAMWHRAKLAEYHTDGLLCSHCRYVLPRTVDEFYMLGRQNLWKSRCQDCMNTQVDARPSRQPEAKLAQRCARYGVTSEWYEQQLDVQGNVCAICHRVPANGRYQDFVIDHDHETNIARGLLCSNCNQALGLLEDDADRMERAITYLQKSTI